jgi:hypothetical protein
MTEEYTAKVNAKRKVFGIAPLNAAGLAADNSSMELCKKVIQDTFR